MKGEEPAETIVENRSFVKAIYDRSKLGKLWSGDSKAYFGCLIL